MYAYHQKIPHYTDQKCCLRSDTYVFRTIMCICVASLVPRAHPVFHCVQYGRAGRGWSQGPPSVSLRAVWKSRERLVPGPTQRFAVCSMEEQGEAGPRAHPEIRCVQYGRAGRGWSHGPHPAIRCMQYGRAGRGWSQGQPSVSLRAVWKSSPRTHPAIRCVQYGRAVPGPTQRFAACSMEEQSQGPPSVSLHAVWKSRERLVPGPTQRFAACSMEEQGEAGPRAHPAFRCVQYGRAGRGWSQGPPSISLRAVWRGWSQGPPSVSLHAVWKSRRGPTQRITTHRASTGVTVIRTKC